MAGQYDYMLVARVAGIDDYGRLHQNELSRLPGVTRLETSFALRDVLETTEVVEEADLPIGCVIAAPKHGIRRGLSASESCEGANRISAISIQCANLGNTHAVQLALLRRRNLSRSIPFLLALKESRCLLSR